MRPTTPLPSSDEPSTVMHPPPLITPLTIWTLRRHGEQLKEGDLSPSLRQKVNSFVKKSVAQANSGQLAWDALENTRAAETARATRQRQSRKQVQKNSVIAAADARHIVHERGEDTLNKARPLIEREAARKVKEQGKLIKQHLIMIRKVGQAQIRARKEQTKWHSPEQSRTFILGPSPSARLDALPLLDMAPNQPPKDWAAQDREDDAFIEDLLRGRDSDNDGPVNPLASMGRFNLDVSQFSGSDIGEKAEDAVDYADISDDDLPEEEEPSGKTSSKQNEGDDDMVTRRDTNGKDDKDDPRAEPVMLQGPTPPGYESQNHTEHSIPPESSTTFQADAGPSDDPLDDTSLDDLFADVPSSPVQAPTMEDVLPPVVPVVNRPGSQQSATSGAQAPGGTPEPTLDFDNPHLRPQTPPLTAEEFQAMWPTFRQEDVMKWVRLLPPPKRYWQGKTPLRSPKLLPPLKAGLQVVLDEEERFAAGAPAKVTRQEEEMRARRRGLVPLPREEPVDGVDDPMDIDLVEDEDEDDHRGEMIGKYTWNDIQMVCADWSADQDSEPEETGPKTPEDRGMNHVRDWEGVPVRSTKRRKLDHPTLELEPLHTWAIPMLDDPEQTTAEMARKVILDLNDPELVVDEQEPGVDSTMAEQSMMGEASSIANPIAARRMYNIANDQAYAQLKENHQNKVRGTLGNLVIEHSMPARRLQYPHYRVKLTQKELRNFHRPEIRFVPNSRVHFSQTDRHKKKLAKRLETSQLFAKSKDLTLADNSHMMLLEYSEEYPTMLSNFGMGNRVTNYYRRKADDDTARPKLDIGETAVLMPQDRSPFSMFGHVDPGEVVPTLENGMFRAPIFKHETNPTDFLVMRTQTGVEGQNWYMREVDNLYVVGQQFPLVDVPGPNSRRVTTASRDRLRAIAFRKLRRNPNHRVGVSEITAHFPGTVDATTRGKLKEFLQYNKELKVWEPRPGEMIPEEADLREMIKPEDVCLLDATQAGVQRLEDAGYGVGGAEFDEDDFKKDDQNSFQQLAPWNTTKNFLHATQGKAMLEVYGEGDPSGKGEAFSFIRTSMKGGFKALGQSVEDRLDARKSKELGGHAYNVAHQQKSYDDAIRKIWEAQKRALTSTDRDIDDDDAEASGDDGFEETQTPMSESIPHRSMSFRPEDDTVSQFSRFTGMSQRGKVLRITREYNRNGEIERVEEVIDNPHVIREYLRRRHALEAENTNLSDLKPTGDAEQDRRNQQLIDSELARLMRNKERTAARDKQKGILHDHSAISPGSPSSAGPLAMSPFAPASSAPALKGTGTNRRCANCNQTGHIKTNKKLCPKLNGTWARQQGESQGDAQAQGGPSNAGSPAPMFG
ncbi:MAG: Cell wall alpha-1,3-glucan synthase ags1 [Watsoniomyces obsoletus]|nr:MAG: Cell wall alpha-1,3-glucan synthase ags1 [Watsoniomyces obsoletus]